jgi:hypothetical protein
MRRRDIRAQTASVRLSRDQTTETPRWYTLWSGLALAWSRLESRPASVFVLLSLVFGSAISVVVPPLRGPDEIAHFLRIYSYTRGGLLPATEVDGRKGIFIELELYIQLSFFKNAGERFGRNREQGLRYGEIMREYPLDAEEQATKFMPFAGTEGYNPVAYAPYALGAAIGDLLGLHFPNMLLLMRLLGLITFTAGDPTWRNLTALDYHFWTQPLPTPLAWYAAQLPHWVLASATAATLLIELGLVFLIWLPRRPRAVAAWAVLLFQLIILLTGNYNFFNLLTMLLCVFLFDDAALRRLVPVRLTSWIEVRAPRPGRVATAVAAGLALIVVPVGLNRIWQPLTHTDLPLAGRLTEAISPLLTVSPYGLFVTTTTTRPEIIIEGSDDGQTWREYVFRYRPGPVSRRPTWNIPHQPRLDWQMWFAAYRNVAENPWFERLMQELLKGTPAVLALLAGNPFPDRPPKYVRALLYDYRFADPGTYARTGQWWGRRLEGLYFPQVTLADFHRAVPPETAPLPAIGGSR